MKMDSAYFHAILGELVEENPLACHGVLSVSRVVFTDRVPSLAVSLNEETPRLLVNLDFIQEHCMEEVHVKALLLHEFLHVLLNHTGKYKSMSPFVNLALDAVINHIIHRSCGPEYSAFFRAYYASRAMGWAALLVPAESPEALQKLLEVRHHEAVPESRALRVGLMDGTVLADDIIDLAEDLRKQRFVSLPGRAFLGNHHPDFQAQGGRKPTSKLIIRAMEETFRQLNGEGIFRCPKEHGFGSPFPRSLEWSVSEKNMRAWEQVAWKSIRPLLTPDSQSRAFSHENARAVLPVLNGSDRRGFLQALWSPLLPEIAWDLETRKPVGSTQVYLDVSGSMQGEMNALVTLLNRLRRWIRMPFWAFSTEVVPAVIEGGKLETETTGGTAMNCVLEHLAETRSTKALVITDGYIERCDPQLLEAARRTRLHALVSRDGCTRMLVEAGIPCTQLRAFPN